VVYSGIFRVLCAGVGLRVPSGRLAVWVDRSDLVRRGGSALAGCYEIKVARLCPSCCAIQEMQQLKTKLECKGTGEVSEKVRGAVAVQILPDQGHQKKDPQANEP